MDFGFTNDQGRLDAARAFRDAAAADGWSIAPTYGASESVERAASLERDGFKMMVMARTSGEGAKWRYEAKISIWGPDGLAIKPPNEYDFSAIAASLRRCNYCPATDVDTQRVGFAGRCCEACLPEQRKRVEYPGWTD